MSRKRFVKLLMSSVFSRNDSNYFVERFHRIKKIHPNMNSYAKWYTYMTEVDE